MAEAVRHEAVTQVVEPEKIVLTLSRQEAEALVALAWRTGGHPKFSARRHIDEIRFALDSAGIARSSLGAEYRVTQDARFANRSGADSDWDF